MTTGQLYECVAAADLYVGDPAKLENYADTARSMGSVVGAFTSRGK